MRYRLSLGPIAGKELVQTIVLLGGVLLSLITIPVFYSFWFMFVGVVASVFAVVLIEYKWRSPSRKTPQEQSRD